jgi:hypothetical protein
LTSAHSTAGNQAGSKPRSPSSSAALPPRPAPGCASTRPKLDADPLLAPVHASVPVMITGPRRAVHACHVLADLLDKIAWQAISATENRRRRSGPSTSCMRTCCPMTRLDRSTNSPDTTGTPRPSRFRYDY